MYTDKCHLLVSGHKYEHIWIRVGEDKIWEDNKVKFLGVPIDNELKFDQHVSDICLKPNRKLSVLSRMSKFLTFDQSVGYFIIQKYCPLGWFFHSRNSDNKINRLHERALILVYSDHKSSFEFLLEMVPSLFIIRISKGLS